MIKNRDDFKKYVLRSLGAPVIKINLTEEQLEDRIDEAIDFWQQYNAEGVIHTYLKTRITATELRCVTPDTHKFKAGEKIIGETSKSKAVVVEYMNETQSVHGILLVDTESGEFMRGEMVYSETEPEKKIQLRDTEDYIRKGIIDTHKIEVPDWILGVTNMLTINNGSSSQNLFDYQYQLKMYNLWDLASTSMINYDMTMKHLDLMNWILSACPQFDFNRHEGYIYPILDWSFDVKAGDYIVFEVYRAVNPNQHTKAWNDVWLKRYAIALAKQQWASNLKKFSGIQLAGGVTLNGTELYQEANQERKEIEEYLMSILPPSAMFIG